MHNKFLHEDFLSRESELNKSLIFIFYSLQWKCSCCPIFFFHLLPTTNTKKPYNVTHITSVQKKFHVKNDR